jgi:hypothetical protein
MAACTSAGPRETLQAYAVAVRADDSEAAYDLLTDEAKRDLSYGEFARLWEENRAELLRLDLSGERPGPVRARLVFSDYDEVSLTLSEEGWRISGGLLRMNDQTSPRRSLVSFVRAMEGRRCEVLMGLAPSQYARHMSAPALCDDLQVRDREIKELVELLKEALDNPIEVRGNTAYMRYGNQRVVFLLEGDAWKIDDPDEPL